MPIIHEHEAMDLILQQFPLFRDHWQIYQEEALAAEAGTCSDLQEFALYVDDLLADEEYEQLPAIFGLVERFLTDGDHDVRWSTAYCFLETLLSIQADTEHWTHLLGPHCRAFCRSWDQVAGNRTPGLWFH